MIDKTAAGGIYSKKWRLFTVATAYMLLRSLYIIKVKTCPFKLFKFSREIGDHSSHYWL